MPRSAFWAPITAARFLALKDIGGGKCCCSKVII
jgi:hypothetical protein